jgi:hypothetical protein
MEPSSSQQRILDDIGAHLWAEDPELAAALRWMIPPPPQQDRTGRVSAGRAGSPSAGSGRRCARSTPMLLMILSLVCTAATGWALAVRQVSPDAATAAVVLCALVFTGSAVEVAAIVAGRRPARSGGTPCIPGADRRFGRPRPGLPRLDRRPGPSRPTLPHPGPSPNRAT